DRLAFQLAPAAQWNASHGDRMRQRCALVVRPCLAIVRPIKGAKPSMKRSTNRILTTHVGSLPRPADLLDMQDGSSEPKGYEQSGGSPVGEIVSKQAELGIDIVDDGEYSKPSFVTYINERLGGFETDKTGGITNQWSRSREALAFPDYYNSPANAGPP